MRSCLGSSETVSDIIYTKRLRAMVIIERLEYLFRLKRDFVPSHFPQSVD